MCVIYFGAEWQAPQRAESKRSKKRKIKQQKIKCKPVMTSAYCTCAALDVLLSYLHNTKGNTLWRNFKFCRMHILPTTKIAVERREGGVHWLQSCLVSIVFYLLSSIAWLFYLLSCFQIPRISNALSTTDEKISTKPVHLQYLIFPLYSNSLSSHTLTLSSLLIESLYSNVRLWESFTWRILELSQ